MRFKGKTIFITGGSRGIGLAVIKKLACDGANIIIAAKTTEPHPKLPGTIFTAAKEVEESGGCCLPIECDIRFENSVTKALEAGADKFGGIDICINNASAIAPFPTPATDMKRYDLMHDINTRGTFMVTKLCLPYLKNSEHSHVLTFSPPLDLDDKWFAPHVAYTISKMGMSLLTLGHAREFKKFSIAVNSLWPLTAIDTAAVRNVLGGENTAKSSRSVDIMADAAYEILSRDPKKCTGNFFIDEVVLREIGEKNFEKYSLSSADLIRDFFIPDDIAEGLPTQTVSIYK
jgi:citronellol/citronellal dehydrogenase